MKDLCDYNFVMHFQLWRMMRGRTMMVSHSALPWDQPGLAQKETTLMMR